MDYRRFSSITRATSKSLGHTHVMVGAVSKRCATLLRRWVATEPTIRSSERDTRVNTERALGERAATTDRRSSLDARAHGRATPTLATDLLLGRQTPAPHPLPPSHNPIAIHRPTLQIYRLQPRLVRLTFPPGAHPLFLSTPLSLYRVFPLVRTLRWPSVRDRCGHHACLAVSPSITTQF